MSGIREATAITLTEAERAELEGLARSTKTEYRLRQRARIVLLAADGMASRAIGREVGCTTGTASKWRVRYAPGAIYQVDAGTQLVTAIASLLTGGLAVGQPLPPSYSVYNVPLGYRDTYYDRPDAWYRYSDGYIYQVDPTTQLITAIVRSIV